MAKPLIASDVPGCGHVIDDGVDGLLCHVRDAEDLARQRLAMIKMPGERRAEMAQASRANAEQEFDEAIVAGPYLNAVGSALQS